MSTETGSKTERRVPLNRELVLRAAVALADRDGIESLTMRKLGLALGVKAMALYNHVRNKDDILDGIVDLVLGDIDVPPAGTHWKTAMRQRSISAHEVLLEHPWAAMLIMSRFNIGPGMTRYLDATLGRLRAGGFSVTGALDAWHTLDSHLFGFTLQQLNLPFGADEAPQMSADVLDAIPIDDYPHVIEVISHVMQHGRAEDFELGLDLILDGLERTLDQG
ncbi:TetR family transcriptional regulator [Kribbella pittospori]|uniref:TetR family transcriptional regulator n=1 Tax=Kribbella pittospori TaxID=722689 RepID=A0A4R0JN66_9ACTN|nr:TetR/AcrR family transcriptional regulator C-terminal domain-containing protein [Kribbella pittospori]TCC46318.1 TetR family transcriptional regulator [Kribbella pittospori]